MSQISDGILFIIWGYLLFLSVVLFASALRYFVSFFQESADDLWSRWVGPASFLLPRVLINSGLLYLLVMNVDSGWINVCVGCRRWFFTHLLLPPHEPMISPVFPGLRPSLGQTDLLQQYPRKGLDEPVPRLRLS